MLVYSSLGTPCRADVASAPLIVPAPEQASATLFGRVHSLGSPDPIPDAKIQLTGLSRSALSDRSGAFALAGPAGLWTLTVSADAYATLTKTVRLKPGERLRLSLGLNAADFQGATVTVLGHRQRPQAIQATITQAQIREIPGTFGDALRAVEILPGVGVPSDLSGRLVIQGGGPNDNLYLIDSIPWPNPYHFGGFDSTVSTDLLDSVDLYEAGYGARWGGALSAVLDGHTVAPPTDRLHVDANVGILETSGALSGPLGLGDARFMVTGRRSYFDLVGDAVGDKNLPEYWDSQGVLDFSLGPDNRFHGLFMASTDTFNDEISQGGDNAFNGAIQYDVEYETGGLSWTNTSLKDFVSTLTPYAYHNDTIQQVSSGGTDLVDDTYQTTYGLKEEAEWTPGPWMGAGHEVSAGGELEQDRYNFYGAIPRDLTDTANENFNELVSQPLVNTTVKSLGLDSYAYLQDRVQFNEVWALTLGAHYDSNSLVSDGELGPRVGLEYKPGPDDKVAAAWGLYDQAPSSIQVDPQAGNPGLEPESAEHVALNYEHHFSPSLTGSVDGYYKTLSDLVVSDPSNPGTYDNRGVGDVKGADLSLKEDLGQRFFGMFTYSLSNSDRLNLPSQAWGLYQYDEPDILNAVACYSPDAHWNFGVKLRYNSGNLVQPSGVTTYNSSDRLPAYVRIDVRAQRRWLFQQWTLTAYFEILNLLDRKNVSMDFVNSAGQTDTVPDLPLIPNIGLEAKY